MEVVIIENKMNLQSMEVLTVEAGSKYLRYDGVNY